MDRTHTIEHWQERKHLLQLFDLRTATIRPAGVALAFDVADMKARQQFARHLDVPTPEEWQREQLFQALDDDLYGGGR